MRNLYSCVLHLSYRYFFSRFVERYVIEGERQSLLLVFCPSFNDVIVLRENDNLFCWCFVYHSTFLIYVLCAYTHSIFLRSAYILSFCWNACYWGRTTISFADVLSSILRCHRIEGERQTILLVLYSFFHVFVYLLFFGCIFGGHNYLFALVMLFIELLAPFTGDCLWGKQSIFDGISLIQLHLSFVFSMFFYLHANQVGLLSSIKSFLYGCFLCSLSWFL